VVKRKQGEEEVQGEPDEQLSVLHGRVVKGAQGEEEEGEVQEQLDERLSDSRGGVVKRE
jgi:hypothetical protein